MKSGPRLAVTSYSIRILFGQLSPAGHTGCAWADHATAPRSGATRRRVVVQPLSAFIGALEQTFGHVPTAVRKTQPDWQITQRRRKPDLDPCIRRTGPRPVELERIDRPRLRLDRLVAHDEEVIR